MRDRTWVGTEGGAYDGAEMIGTLWDAALDESIHTGRTQFLEMMAREIRHALDGRSDADDLWDEFLSLGTVRRPATAPGSTRPMLAGKPPRCIMKFGIFYEHQLPRPWDEDSERQLIQDALDQVEFADEVGIDYVWEVEHHFLEEYSHSSAPEVFLAAASQRTKNIRLGHGIIQTAPNYNHPARTAERVAMLDLVSNGRVDFGSGESSSEAELGGFGIEYMEKRDQWLEGLEVAIRCMTETPFTGHEGKYCSMPPRNVVPKPVQKPHPPLWVACSRRDTILLAAEKGIGALSFAFIDPEEAEHWVNDYKQTIAEKCVPVGQAVNPDIACVTPMMCAANEEDAIAARPRRRQLLRLLARPLLRVRRARARQDQRVGRVPGATRQDGLLARGRPRRAERDPRRQGRVGRGNRAPRAASAPPTSSASTSSASRRPASIRSSSCCRRARTATSTSWRASSSSARGAARVQGARRGAPRRKAKEWEPIIEAAMARKVDDAPRDARRLRDEGHPQADGRDGRRTSRRAVDGGSRRQAGGRRAGRGVRATLARLSVAGRQRPISG